MARCFRACCERNVPDPDASQFASQFASQYASQYASQFASQPAVRRGPAMGAALIPAGRSAGKRSTPPSEPAQRFVDFSIRAWLEGYSVGVITHSSPVGGMRAPVFVRVGEFDARAYRLPLKADWAAAAALGRELARWLLPPPVWALLDRKSVV